MMRGAGVVASVLLSACTVGPDYKPPQIPIPERYSDLPASRAETPASLTTPVNSDLSQWWTQFHDPELNKLVAQAMASNLDLMSAASRIAEAREQEIQAGAKGLPQIDASAVAARVHSNSGLVSLLGSAPPQTPTASTNTKIYSVAFDASWELDVFGGIRRSVEAAHASTEASLWALRDAEVMLTSEVATNYLTLRALQFQIALLKDEARRQNDTLMFIQARRRAGFVTELDVNQQISLRASTQAQIPTLEASAGAAEHAIAVLLGEPPAAPETELNRMSARPVVPEQIAVGLPSALLLRRPDVRESERQLAAATANIGVAVSGLYPKFDLLAALSLASSHASTLFTGNSLNEAELGSVMWPVFHGGQIRANIRSKEDETEQAYLAYKKAILTALQDVEDSLLRYEKDQQRLVELERAANSARSSSDIAYQQYRVGLAAYIDVLTAQSTDLAAQVQLEQGRQALTIDLVSLYKALGGGWAIPAAEVSSHN